MAGLKPSANLFALLDRIDPGDKRIGDFDAANAKNKAPAAASLTARDYVIRQNQLEKQAKARKRAAARAKSAGASANGNTSKIKADAAKRGGYINSNSGPSRKQQQSGTPGGYKSFNGKGESGRQQPAGMAEGKVRGEGVKAPPAAVQALPPPQPPSLYDIEEFPSLK